MNRKINRTWRVVMIVLVVLVAFRLSLPYILTRYVNKVLDNLEGYHGHIEDVNIHLLRGAYDLVNLKLKKDDARDISLLSVPFVELSVEWQAALTGSFVGEIILSSPSLHLYPDNHSNESLDSVRPLNERANLHNFLKRIMPLPINHFQINSGRITFIDRVAEPEVNVFLKNVQLDATNLTNASDNPEHLPSRVYIQAFSIGNGQLNIATKANFQKAIPDMDMDIRFEKVEMKALDALFASYGNADIQGGDFNLFCELAIANGQITGFIKPLMNNVKMTHTANEVPLPINSNFQKFIIQLTNVFNESTTDKFVTRVSVQGQITEMRSHFWPALWNVFSNAVTEAFVDNSSISLAAVEPIQQQVEKPEETRSKKELRKERRKERRLERKKQRKEKELNEFNEKAESERDPDDKS